MLCAQAGARFVRTAVVRKDWDIEKVKNQFWRELGPTWSGKARCVSIIWKRRGEEREGENE